MKANFNFPQQGHAASENVIKMFITEWRTTRRDFVQFRESLLITIESAYTEKRERSRGHLRSIGVKRVPAFCRGRFAVRKEFVGCRKLEVVLGI